MESISDYTIFCTPEQTKKALELGVPIEKDCSTLRHDVSRTTYINGNYYCNPTAEQMRGWLGGQGIYIIAPIPLIKDFIKSDFSKADAFEYIVVINGGEPYRGEYLSDKEAIITAIDNALEYLINERK